MYTILVTNDNELVTTVAERIMQRSKLVDKLRFLVEPEYNGYMMDEFEVRMAYLSPVSGEPHNELLLKEDDLYADKLQYILPIDTCLTKEAGNVTVTLTFTKVELDELGNSIQRIRKTDEGIIPIVANSAWSNMITDDAVGALDQKVMQVSAMLNAVNDLAQSIYEEKADNIKYKDNTIWLTANGEQIGDVVTIDPDCACDTDEEGDIPWTYI